MKRIYVIGGANIDIIGRPDHECLLRDSNIGKIHRCYGGVGRNIAENIARYGLHPYFISAVGNDNDGKGMLDYCESCGMNISYIRIVHGVPTSTYLAVLDQYGDMLTAINDMRILEKLDASYLESIVEMIDEEDIVVVDTNLEKCLLDWLLPRLKARIFVDPISVNKAKKLEGLYSYIYAFKPNVYEAEALTGIACRSEDDLIRMGQYFVDQGVKETYISLSSGGVLAMTENEMCHLKPETIQVVNATGAGDAFMGALAANAFLDKPLEERLRFAQCASILTLSCQESVCQELSYEKVEDKMKEIHFEEIKKGESICF